MAIGYGVPVPKPPKRDKKAPKRIRVKAKPRAERKQIDSVRAHCVERDGFCRIGLSALGTSAYVMRFMVGSKWLDSVLPQMTSVCNGPSEWAHMHERRRSKTRGMSPEYRHDTAHSLMLCHKHHEDYDAKRLHITALTRKGANGPLKFRSAK